MRQHTRNAVGFVVLAILMAALFYWNINTGSVHLSLERMLTLLRWGNDGTTEGNILWKIRLSRLLGAALLGGALSIAGFLLQTFFKNPIAGPFVLGISSKKVKVELNSHFLIGPDGAHLNISGISGLAAKTSYSMFLLNAIQHKFKDIDGSSVAFVFFNVKGRDLMAIDETDPRRTEICAVSGEVDIEDLIPQEECVLTLTQFG